MGRTGLKPATTLADLVPDPANRRVHSERNLAMVREALETVGTARSIVIDETNTILAGNGVTAAATAAGLTKVRIVESDGDEVIAVRRRGLTDEQKRALALYDNRTAELAEWKVDQLQTDLAAGLDFAPWFSSTELQALVGPDVKPGFTDPDAVPDERATDIQRGDFFELGRHRLLCGDATAADDVARVMGIDAIHSVITDPPYGKRIVKSGMVGANFGVAKKGRYVAVTGDEHPATVRQLLDLAPQCVIWGGNYFADQLPLTSSWFVWDKRSETGIENTFADCELAWANVGGPARIYRQLWNGMIREGEHDKRQHPTQKPVQLLIWCMDRAAGNVIADPYLGSGTTLIAAEQLGRACRAIEIEPRYCQVAIDRWEAFTGQTAVKVGGA